MEEAQRLQSIQPIVFRQLQNSFEHGRLAHAYLLRAIKGPVKRSWRYGLPSICFA